MPLMPRLSLMAALAFMTAAPLPALADDSNEPRVPPQLQKLYDRRQADIDAMDANKDGILQPEELQAGTDGKFKAADLNGDGVISPEEAQQAVATFETDHQDMYGNQTERKGRELEQRLDKIDANEDGIISQAEYEAYYKERYTKLDKDGDGALNVKEYETDVEEKRRRRN